MKKKQKYKFLSYYKFTFYVIGEDGVNYRLESDSCNGEDIYRLDINTEGEMFYKDGFWEIDGMKFIPNQNI